MSAVLKPEIVGVRHEGELVVLKFGNTEIKMHYTHALQLSGWLRVHGKAAKRLAGDHSVNWAVRANLTAAENGERPMR